MKRCLHLVIVSIVSLLICLQTSRLAADVVLQTSTFNGHTYHLVSNKDGTRIDWSDAEAFALTLGGHLVTINDAAENEFLLSEFSISAMGAKASAHPSGGLLSLWIGYNDVDSEGTFNWVAGNGSSFRNWKVGEPAGNHLDEDFAAMLVTSDFGPAGTWHDVVSDFRFNDVTYGIVEVVPEPGSLACFFSGMAMLIGSFHRYRRRLIDEKLSSKR